MTPLNVRFTARDKSWVWTRNKRNKIASHQEEIVCTLAGSRTYSQIQSALQEGSKTLPHSLLLVLVRCFSIQSYQEASDFTISINCSESVESRMTRWPAKRVPRRWIAVPLPPLMRWLQNLSTVPPLKVLPCDLSGTAVQLYSFLAMSVVVCMLLGLLLFCG